MAEAASDLEQNLAAMEGADYMGGLRRLNFKPFTQEQVVAVFQLKQDADAVRHLHMCTYPCLFVPACVFGLDVYANHINLLLAGWTRQDVDHRGCTLLQVECDTTAGEPARLAARDKYMKARQLLVETVCPVSLLASNTVACCQLCVSQI